MPRKATPHVVATKDKTVFSLTAEEAARYCWTL